MDDLYNFGFVLVLVLTCHFVDYLIDNLFALKVVAEYFVQSW